jgi:hypothetical protein
VKLHGLTMPRRPVKPQDRQRVVRACDQCKASKKRCDGGQPCKPCQKKGYDCDCHYTAGRRHHPLPQPTSTILQIVSAPNAPPDLEGSGADLALISPDSWDVGLDALSVGDPGPNVAPLARDPTPEDGSQSINTRGCSIEVMAQPAVMLSSGGGEKGKLLRLDLGQPTPACDTTNEFDSICRQYSSDIISTVPPKDSRAAYRPFRLH